MAWKNSPEFLSPGLVDKIKGMYAFIEKPCQAGISTEHAFGVF
jgi:hypothetical protein